MYLDESHFFLNSSQAIIELCRPLRQINVTHFSYTKSQTNGKRIYLTTHPELLQNYFLNHFHMIGNCECRPDAYLKQAFLWSTLPKQCIYEEAKKFGMKDGIFMIYPQSSYTEFFNFSTTNKNIHIANIFFNYLEVLKSFIDYFKMEAASLIKQGENSNFILPHCHEPFTLIEETLDSDHLLKQFFPKKKWGLSNQQYQCAIKLIKGKSIKEIAQDLNLSPRTIETYVNNLKNKFKLRTKTELCIKLSDLLSH